MMGVTDKSLFIEEIVLNSVKRLLSGRVNELLGEVEFMIPPIQFSHKPLGGYYAVTTEITIAGCERTEKERIVRLDAYVLTIAFAAPEHPDGERNCYAYASSVAAALGEDPTLGGTVDRAVLTGKKYRPPKCAGAGEGWELVLTLRLTVEGGSYAG
jgi:hypothetical protein